MAAEVAPDLKTCKAYISVLGDAYEQEQTIKGLQSAEGYIRRELARTLNLRNTPEIKFVLDQSIEYGVNMSKKIDEVTKDLKTEGVEEDAEKSIGERVHERDRRTCASGWRLCGFLCGTRTVYP